MKIIILAFVLSLPTLASISQDCAKLSSCVEAVSKITGKKYVYDADIDHGRFKIGSSSNNVLTRDNADALFSEMLYLSDLCRIPLSDNSYKIIPARNLNGPSLPQIKASTEQEPKLPDNSDFYQMIYSFSNIPAGYPINDAVYSSIRRLLSRNGHLAEIRGTNSFIIIDTAKNLQTTYSMLKEMDKAPSKNAIKRYEENRKHRQKIELIEAKNCQDLKAEVASLKKGKSN